jgi:hypothetical protein
MSTMRALLFLLCLSSVATCATAESTAAPPAALAAEGAGAKASAESAAKHCGDPHTPGPHICSLIIQSIGVEGSGPGTSAELVTNVAGPSPRCYHAPAPGTLPNVAGMTRRLLKSWRGHKPILLDSYYPDDKSQSCEWLLRDQLPCPPTGGQADPPCIINPSSVRYEGGKQVLWPKPAAPLSEACQDPKQDTQFCSGYISSIDPVKDSESWTVHLEKPAICVTIDPAADQTSFKIWQAKLELARAAKDEHVQAVVLFPTEPKPSAGACPALYQIDIQ